MIPLADLAASEAEHVVECLVIVGLVAAAVYGVCGILLKQPWAGTAAAIVFLVGAILCVL